MQSPVQWIDSTRSRLAPNVEVDGTPWRPGQQSEAEDAPTEPFDTDLQAQVAELTDRVEELTEAAVRGRKELPTARREAWEGREALRHRVQQALDKRAEQRSRRARKAMLKSAGKDPVTLPGLERRDEQSCTLAAALKDVEQLELVRVVVFRVDTIAKSLRRILGSLTTPCILDGVVERHSKS